MTFDTVWGGSPLGELNLAHFLSPRLKQNSVLLPYRGYEKNSYISPGSVV